MRVFIILFIFLSLPNCYAFDFDAMKERLRSPMAKMLGEDTTNKFLGEVENKNQIELPTIPKVKSDAKDLSYFDKKKSKVYFQGDKYNNLTNEKKRSFRISFLQQLFLVTRNTEAKKEDVVTFLNVLEQDGSREGVYRAVVLDRVYYSLEQYDEVPSKFLISFVVGYSNEFLAIKYKAKSIQKFNLWALKRIITEKTLELIDVLADKPETLYRWYAVFSKTLAQENPSAWNSDVRGNDSDVFHYNWSKSVPLQHIKSEVIIKLHKTMNFLNQKES